MSRHYPPGKLRQLPNAIDLERFGPVTQDERAAARRKLGLSPDARVIHHFCWDWHVKGRDLLGTTDRTTPALQPLAPQGPVNELSAADVFPDYDTVDGINYTTAARARVAASYSLGRWSRTMVPLYMEALHSGRRL